MPLTRFKLSAIADGGIDTDELADGAVTLVKTDNLFENTTFTGDDGIVVPKGTTAERPVSPTVGEVRFNTTLDQLEQYTADGWKGISAPPTISGIDQTNVDYASDPFTLVITGQNFDTTSSATLTDNNGVTLTATSSTRNSSSQITLVYSGSELSAIDADTPEPLIVKVTNGSGLTALLEGSLGVDDNPVWSSPAAGSSQTVYEDVSTTIALSATDPESGGSITYSVSSGTLPTGLSLSGSNITGTPNVNDTYNASGVTTPITITATGADNETTTRSFNIIRRWKDGSSSASAAVSAQAIRDLGITTDGTFWVQPSGASSAYEVHCYNSIESGGWELAYRFGSTTNNTSSDGSGSWGVANWAGWGNSSQSAVDSQSGNNDYSVAADNDAQSPSFAHTPFTDWMVISNRSGQTSRRTGHRMGSTMTSLYAVTGGTSTQNYTTNVLFGSLQWLQVLDVKSPIDAWGGATRAGFKIRSDAAGTTNTTNFTGGFHTSSMHYGSQIGIGRETSSDSGKFGGGFGGNYSNTDFFKMHGHWWGHGMSWQTGSANDGNVWYGHAVYVRSNA